MNPALVCICPHCGKEAEPETAEVVLKDGAIKGVVLPIRCATHGLTVYGLRGVLWPADPASTVAG